MKIFGLSPAALVLHARDSTAQVIADSGDDLAEAPPIAIWPSAATDAERNALQNIFKTWRFEPAEVVSVLGVVRTVDARLPNVLALQRDKPVTLLSLRGWREWSAAHVARGLTDAGFVARVVEMQMHGTPIDASAAQVAARFEDPVFHDKMLHALSGAAQVLLPPVLASANDALALGEKLGAVVGDAVGTTQHLAAEAELTRVEKTFARSADAQTQLLAAWRDGEQPVIVASRRAAAWLETHLSLPRITKARLDRGNWFACGRARSQVQTLADEWLDALRLAASLGAEAA